MSRGKRVNTVCIQSDRAEPTMSHDQNRETSAHMKVVLFHTNVDEKRVN